MKITSINPIGFRNINNVNNRTSFVYNRFSSDSVSFSSKESVSLGSKFEDTKIRMQARDIERRTGDILKESTKLQEDAYLLKRDSSNIKKDAQGILQDGKDLFLSVKQALIQGKSNSFKPVQNSDGYTTRMFKVVSGNEVIIEDFADVTDEDPSRIVSINSDTTSVYDTDVKSGQTDVYIFDTKSGRLKKYAQDVSLHKQDYSAAKQYVFSEKSLYSFDISHKSSSDKHKKSAERYIFAEDGKLKNYFSDFSSRANGVVTSSERFDFEEGRLKRYSSMNYLKNNELVKSGEKFVFSVSGDVKTYSQGHCQYPNNENTSELYFVFGNDSVESVYVDFSTSDSIKAQKVFSFVDGYANKCTFDFNKSKDGTVTYSKSMNVQTK